MNLNCSYNSLAKLLSWAEKLFIKHKLFFGHGSTNAWDEAVFIASHVLKINLYKAELKEQILNTQQKKAFISIVADRIKTKQPLPYIINTAWFAAKKYYVDRRVIIPRSPFAELISAKFKPWINKTPKAILDLCTGSGCIAIACYNAFIANNYDLKVDASDISEQALAVANKNLILHKLNKKINLIKSDLFKSIPKYKYDLIISNPPYVDLKTFNKLPLEFHAEPKLALVSGKQGSEIVDRILRDAKKFLTKQGVLIVEVGYLYKKIQKLYPKLDFTWINLENGGEGIFLLTRKQLDDFCFN